MDQFNSERNQSISRDRLNRFNSKIIKLKNIFEKNTKREIFNEWLVNKSKISLPLGLPKVRTILKSSPKVW